MKAIFTLNFFTMGEQEMDLIRNSGSDLDFRDNGIQGCVRLSDLLSIPDSK